MERSTSLSRQQETPGTVRCDNGFRNRARSLFRGTSSISAQNVGSAASNARAPRMWLSLFSDERIGRPRRRQSDHTVGYRRTQPLDPSSIEMAEAGLSGRHFQTQTHVNDSHHNLSQTIAGATPDHFGARARRKYDNRLKQGRFCGGPGMRSKEARKKLVDCALASSLVLILFIIYLSLSLSNIVQTREFHIVLILALTVFVIYFCHSFILFFMLSWRTSPTPLPPAAPKAVSTLEYALPDEPIPVILARDEEIMMEVDSNNRNGSSKHLGGLAPPPPAYGLWRDSVKINPNLVHWQRRDPTNSHGRGTGNDNVHEALNRPPSYDGDLHRVIDEQPQLRLHVPDGLDIQPGELLEQKR
ncbi:hypothetical protein HCBG_00309 [Histoplasma capsulatum G186AR]|uniref:Uncharacterized protein n=2 Tax=Ajellomyces capsulatus TaxID=5037 RepID=C0NB13_AJECG|nr:uncharacterized protein HCBG_00309 [Histoplasma capsulatum G186AR]EEH10854.1 hypothetical protein HCBG_00309 [Histoplasma capsulatum G186AR]KAG5288728.1 hypothetical protein I7I52_12308 [Histoplasma capsulatum]QSS71304.1 hypothetical protein I7I50_02094 [Histoplasma capsulatum G186AR]